MRGSRHVLLRDRHRQIQARSKCHRRNRESAVGQHFFLKISCFLAEFDCLLQTGRDLPGGRRARFSDRQSCPDRRPGGCGGIYDWLIKSNAPVQGGSWQELLFAGVYLDSLLFEYFCPFRRPSAAFVQQRERRTAARVTRPKSRRGSPGRNRPQTACGIRKALFSPTIICAYIN